MKYKATAQITLKREVLDPQGDAVSRALQSLGHSTVGRVRVGKLIEIELEAEDESAAKDELQKMGERLLANPVIEDFTVTLESR